MKMYSLRKTSDCVIDSTYNDAFGLEQFSFETTVATRNFKELKLFFSLTFFHCLPCLFNFDA